MDDELLRYYERELAFVRKMGEEFAKKYPKVASRLMLEPGKCEDPHTERLIEAFAFLSGRIHKKIEDNFPEITESLLGIIYPHYIRPIPSMSIVEFRAAMNQIPPEGFTIEKGTSLYSKPVGGIPCQFSTSYPVTLRPMQVSSVTVEAPRHTAAGGVQALVIRLKARDGVTFSQITMDELRFFLNGAGQQVYPLYEFLAGDVTQVVTEFKDQKGKTQSLALGRECLEPSGFDLDQGLMPYSGTSFPGYGLLLEYFTFPEKFLFFTLKGFERLRESKPGNTLDVWIYLARPLKTNTVINTDNFVLHATPVINLFKRVAEPVWLDRTKNDYQVIPDVRRPLGTEVFDIDSVEISSEESGEEVQLHPFYSIRHHLGDEHKARKAFWRMERRPSPRKGDDGTDVFLSFTDWDLKPTDLGIDTVMVRTTCTNRDLPGRLPFGDPQGDFEMELAAAAVERITCLVKPTPTRRPALGAALQWRLISHLALNYLSISEGGEDALRELLKLYDFDDSPATRQQISGIVGLTSDYVTRRVGQGFCRGLQVTVTFDEDKYVGSGLYLFASVLERFLTQYVSINSFTQMTARTLQRKEPVNTWRPRNGNRILL